MRLLAISALVVAAAGLPACKASVSASANVNSGAKAEINDFDKPLEAEAAARSMAAAEEPAHEAPLLGSRPDVSFKGTATPNCQCLAAAVGMPSAFEWSGEHPYVDKDNQLVIALTSSGIDCPAAGGKATSASYWGYELQGNDVVVVVENAVTGRPAPQGAIIPRPMGGQVYVRPASKAVPYGRPLSGGGDRCQISSLSASPATPTGAKPDGKSFRIKTEEEDPTSSKTEIP